jgi:hypothetical protein
MACADDAKASAKATANNLIIVTLLLKSPKAGLLPLGAHQPTSGGRSSLIWINECSLPSWGIRVRGAVTPAPCAPPLRQEVEHG